MDRRTTQALDRWLTSEPPEPPQGEVSTEVSTDRPRRQSKKDKQRPSHWKPKGQPTIKEDKEPDLDQVFDGEVNLDGLVGLLVSFVDKEKGFRLMEVTRTHPRLKTVDGVVRCNLLKSRLGAILERYKGVKVSQIRMALRPDPLDPKDCDRLKVVV